MGRWLVDLAGLRVALTPDFGFAPTEKHIASIFAEKTKSFRHVFARADDATPDCSGTDEAFEVLRALGYLASHLDKVRKTPAMVGMVGENVMKHAPSGRTLIAPGKQNS